MSSQSHIILVAKDRPPIYVEAHLKKSSSPRLYLILEIQNVVCIIRLQPSS